MTRTPTLQPEEAAGSGEAVGDDEVAPQLRRVLPAERHVQPAEVGGQLGLQRVVDLVVEDRGARCGR